MTAVALVDAVAQVQFPAQELPHAMGGEKKKKKKIDVKREAAESPKPQGHMRLRPVTGRANKSAGPGERLGLKPGSATCCVTWSRFLNLSVPHFLHP